MQNLQNRPIKATLRTKNDRYYAVFYTIGREGKPKEIWRTLELEVKPGNKRKAEDKMEEMKYQFRGVLDVPGYEIAFVDYMRKWKEKKEGEVQDSTYEKIKRVVEGKIVTYFEPMGLRLSEVKPKHIKHFYEYMYKNGRADGQGGLSASNLKGIKSILNEAFKTALLEGLVENNPVESVKLPVKDNPRKPHNVLYQEEANRLLGHVVDDELMYPLLLTALRYGLRRCEVLGLKWEAIDFQKNTIRIKSEIVNGKNPEKNRTKTQSSMKTFPLLPDIKDALNIRKKAQDKNREKFGKLYIENDYVFTYKNGRFLSPDWVTDKFISIVKECGLPYMRFHDLRHSTACIIYENGMGILELQKWMRHSKIEMTADVYLHISKKREKELANGLQNLFSDKTEPKDDFIENKFKLA